MLAQNSMGLDMLLAENGDVCTMCGAHCCTSIPNNTAPGGSVSVMLVVFATNMLYIGVFDAILTCCGCCFYPLSPCPCYSPNHYTPL